jgi:hypothetical protein
LIANGVTLDDAGRPELTASATRRIGGDRDLAELQRVARELDPYRQRAGCRDFDGLSADCVPETTRAYNVRSGPHTGDPKLASAVAPSEKRSALDHDCCSGDRLRRFCIGDSTGNNGLRRCGRRCPEEQDRAEYRQARRSLPQRDYRITGSIRGSSANSVRKEFVGSRMSMNAHALKVAIHD